MGYYQGKGPVRISGKLYDSNSLVGTASSVLISTGVGVSWAPITDVATTSTDVIGGIASVTSLNVSGVATATSFEGSGTDLTGIVTSIVAGTNITISGSTGQVTINASGGSGGSTTLGNPTDNDFSDGLLSFTSSTTVTDAIDEVNEVLSKLAPAKPPNLSTKTLSLSTSYGATETLTGDTKTSVTNDSTPQTNVITEFWDGESGVLKSYVDLTETGSITLSASSDANTTNGDLEITADADYPATGNGAGFWKALSARINVNSLLSAGEHSLQMVHSNTGSTNLTFYVNDTASPTITNETFDVSSATSTYSSGVPSIASNQIIKVSFTINNALKTFYNSSKVADVSGSILSVTRSHQISGAQTYNGSISVTDAPSGGSLTVGSNKYSETNSLTIKGYSANGTAGTTKTLTLTNVRVDTKSTSESTLRKLSGSGQYPSSGYGGTYDSTQSLKTGDYVNEMQYINGQFKYPPSVNYSNNLPTAGPDYTTGMGSDVRWFCYQHTSSLTAVSAFTLTISGASGFGTAKEVSGVQIYARVDGSGGSGTNGWIDCNSAYPGGGDPTNNGDTAMVFGSSTATSKRVTFGTAAKTGILYIRIGFPSGSSKYFTGVSISLG